MATVNFTPNLKRHIDCPSLSIDGDSVKTVLDKIYRDNPKLGAYILDEQGKLRKHMTIAVDGKMISDRTTLSDKVSPNAEIYVMQALSGG